MTLPPIDYEDHDDLNFEFELELLTVVQDRMIRKMHLRRVLGDNPRYHDYLNKIAYNTDMIREEWHSQFGEKPLRHS